MQKEPRAGCGAAIVIDKQLLLLRRRTEPESGCWGLPGGKIDLFEQAAAATEREIREELDIGISCRDLLCFVDQIDAEAGTHWVAPVYLIQSFTGTPRNVEPAKHDAIQWFNLDALPDQLTTPTRTALAALKQRATI
jgi:ADP-ribose pyrophosphatase YjhB (NUDIX family)